jgi:hypothetical protein
MLNRKTYDKKSLANFLSRLQVNKKYLFKRAVMGEK